MEFLKNLFAANPGTSFSYYLPMLIFIGLLVVASIVFGQIYKSKKKHDLTFKHFFKKTSGRLMVFAIVLAVLVGCRYEAIPYFSMRIWLYGMTLWTIYFIGKTIYTYKESYLPERNHAMAKTTAKQESSKEKLKSYTAKKNRR